MHYHNYFINNNSNNINTTSNKKRKPFFPLSSSTTTTTTTTTGAGGGSSKMPHISSKVFTSSRFKDALFMILVFTTVYLLFHAPPRALSPSSDAATSPTTRRHLLFSIASSASSLPKRSSYLRLWYSPATVRAFTFLDAPVNATVAAPDLPPVIVSKPTSRFPYSFKGGLRSAIRVARVVKEAVDLDEKDVRWFVFGDDDTVFVVENLVKTLGKYDHNEWYYIGSNSESYEQNVKYSFDMGFGGGGFAVSYALGSVLARVLDSCLLRYAHLYGSDARIFSCLAELGVGLTQEPGFHQVDMRGNLFGLLSAHPLSPLVSLHHLDAADPLYPNTNKNDAAERLFEAVNADPTRILQQTVCYNRKDSFTVSIAWGYSIQVFEGIEFLPDLLSVQTTFAPWRRSMKIPTCRYMFNTREFPRDPCDRPTVFFMKNVLSGSDGIQSIYVRHDVGDCSRSEVVDNLERIRVMSQKLELDSEQLKAPRRQCCDISPVFNETMVIGIRQCDGDELISIGL